MQGPCVQPECFVRDDEYRVVGPAPEGVHESTQVPIDVRFSTSTVNGQRVDPITQPFFQLVVPILNQAGGTNNYGLVDQRSALGSLFE